MKLHILLLSPLFLALTALAQDPFASSSFNLLAARHPVQRCSHASQCKHHPIQKGAHHVCHHRKCSFACDDGWSYLRGRCHREKACSPAKCRHHSIPAHSEHWCNSKDQCSFQCSSGFTKLHGKCVPPPTTCHPSQCHQSIPSHSFRSCNSKHECSYTCEPGHYKKDGSCRKKSSLPVGEVCHSSHQCHQPVPSHSAHTCSAGKCGFECKPHYGAVKQNGKWKCVDVYSDHKNCGKVGHICPSDYSGAGSPTCERGHCGLKCPHGQHVHGGHGIPAFCK